MKIFTFLSYQVPKWVLVHVGGMIQLVEKEKYLITIIIGLGQADLTRILMLHIEEPDHHEFSLKRLSSERNSFLWVCVFSSEIRNWVSRAEVTFSRISAGARKTWMKQKTSTPERTSFC